MREREIIDKINEMIAEAYDAGVKEGYHAGRAHEKRLRLKRNSELLAKAVAEGGVNATMPDENGGKARYRMDLTGYEAKPTDDPHVLDEARRIFRDVYGGSGSFHTEPKEGDE